jgi:hypothetical protein
MVCLLQVFKLSTIYVLAMLDSSTKFDLHDSGSYIYAMYVALISKK